ncbi:MAG: ABC transporter permease [Arenicella sp.]
MVLLIIRRLGVMVLTMIAVSIILFLALELNTDSVAISVLGPYSSAEQRELWLEANGYNLPAIERYLSWIGNFIVGDFGDSIRFKQPVAEVLWDRLSNTLILAAVTFSIMIPLAIFLGVLSGMKEGSLMDRFISFICIITTSIPEFASAVFLSAIFVFSLKLLPGTSTMLNGFEPIQLVLPAMVLILYGFGYVARMTRASMAEVMSTHYIRTAILKGLPYKKVILKHALRNALIAPFTIIMLQINWLLSGVIVVEYAFAYKGFGALLLEASLANDVFLIEACTMVAVCAAVLTQLLADIGYSYLNPRIRFS